MAIPYLYSMYAVASQFELCIYFVLKDVSFVACGLASALINHDCDNLCIQSGYFSEGVFLHFCASMISGLVTTAASMPVDMAKTRYFSLFLYYEIKYIINKKHE